MTAQCPKKKELIIIMMIKVYDDYAFFCRGVGDGGRILWVRIKTDSVSMNLLLFCVMGYDITYGCHLDIYMCCNNTLGC